MSELSCKNRTELWQRAKIRARNDEYLLTLIKAINPKKMSMADVDLCEMVLEGDE